jgi:hypothetical protein
MHPSKTDAIDFAMKHSQAKAVIVVVPTPSEEEEMSRKKRAEKRKAQVDAEVERKESEHATALKLPDKPDEAVEKNIVKASADEAKPRPH